MKIRNGQGLGWVIGLGDLNQNKGMTHNSLNGPSQAPTPTKKLSAPTQQEAKWFFPLILIIEVP